MDKIIRYLLLTFFITGCTQAPVENTGQGIKFDRIRVDSASRLNDGSAEMISRCTGFILSKKLVRDFLLNAERVDAGEADKYYRILPCTSTGIVRINQRKYSWIVRSGGIGEFYNDKDRFFMVCGKNCCGKVAGVC